MKTPDNTGSTQPDDLDLDAQLAHWAARTLPDGGFAESVLRRVPAPLPDSACATSLRRAQGERAAQALQRRLSTQGALLGAALAVGWLALAPSVALPEGAALGLLLACLSGGVAITGWLLVGRASV